MNDAKLLNEAGLALPLEPIQQADLVRLADSLACQAGETLFREGERHGYVYWVIDGQVSLEMASSEMTMKPLLTLSAGDLLAWSALLPRRRMTATAKAIRSTRLLRFETDALLELCESNHDIGFPVMQHIVTQLTRRLLATRLQMLDLFQNPVEANQEGGPQT